MDKRFTDIIQLIKQSRYNVIRAVNAELINLYWSIDKHICTKLEKSKWGDAVVTELAKYIQQSVVKYTLPENNEQIFANKYKTVLPSKDKLKLLINKQES